MRRLSSLAWRSLLAQKLRSVLTALGVALGVGVLFAALATGEAMDRAIDRSAAADLGSATLRVTAVAERGLSAETVATIASTAGVMAAAPAFVRQTYLAPGDAAPLATLPPPVTILGIDPVAEPRAHDQSLDSGVALAAGDRGKALISETLARAQGLALGDQLTVNGAAAPGPQTYRIAGVLAGDGPMPDAAGRLVVLTLDDAHTLFASSGATRVDVVTDPANADRLSRELETRLTNEPYMIETQSDLASSLRSSTSTLRGVLLLVAVLVLFVGAFLIFNTLSMTVSERSREVGLLRAAGTTRRQVMDLVLLQAIALGLAGSVLGVAVGVGLALVAAPWLGEAGPSPAEPVPAASVAMAITIGILVTLAAALEPAWRASRIPPVEALRRRGDSRAANAARLRWLLVVFCAIAAVAIVLWPGGIGASSGQSGAAAGGTTWAVGASRIPIPDLASSALGPLLVLGLLLLSVLLPPLLHRPLVALAAVPLRMFRTQERLARSSLARDPSRTALTAGALVVGIAMVVALGAAAQNIRHVSNEWLTETVPGSELLLSVRPVQSDEPARADVEGVPGVISATPIALFGVPLDGVRQDAAALEGHTLLEDGRLTFVEMDTSREASLDALDKGGAVVIPESLSRRRGVHVGSMLTFATGPQSTALRIVGVVAHSIPGVDGESILVGWSDAEKAFGVEGADFFAVRYAAPADSADGGAARKAVHDIALAYALEPADLDRVGSTLGSTLDRVFALLDALAAAAVLVAGLGVVNTLSMSVLERVREIGVLRATGMTSRQVWGMVVVEAAVLGIAGAVLGCIVGLAVAVLLVLASSSGFGLVLDVPWSAMAGAAAFGVLVAILASIYPARLASRLSIVRAFQYE